MASSVVPKIKAAAVKLVTKALPGVQVSYGNPGNTLAREAVYFGDVDPWDQQWGAIGHLSRNEHFDLHFFVISAKPGSTDFQASTEQVFAYLAAIETALRADPNLKGQDATLSATTVTVELVTARVVEEFTDDNSHFSRIEAQLHCSARI